MKIMSAADFEICEVVIRKFSLHFCSKNPWADIDDVRNGAWVQVLIAYQHWQPKSAKLSTYIYTKLHWYGIDLVKSRSRQLRLHNEYGVVMSQEAQLDEQIPTDELARRACGVVQHKLDQSEQKLLGLMLCPTASFRRYVRASKDHRQAIRYTGCQVSHAHYARYLGLPERATGRACERINDLLRKAIANGDC